MTELAGPRPSTGADPMTPSQDAREAAAKLLETQNGPSLYAESVLRGEQDDGDAVQAFARFEAHLRSTSPVGEVGEMIERNKQYLDGHNGRNDLKVGPLMLAFALEESTAMLERLAASDTEAMRLLGCADWEDIWDDAWEEWNAGGPTPTTNAVNRLRKRVTAALAKGGAA